MSEKKIQMNRPQGKSNKMLLIANIALVIFAVLCFALLFVSKNYPLLIGGLGTLAVVATMNVAARISVNKHSAKIFSFISLGLDVIGLLLAKTVILSYIFVVPAAILSKKAFSSNKKNTIAMIAFGISTLALIGCFVLSVGGIITMTAK